MNYSYVAQKYYRAWSNQLICVAYFILPAIIIMALATWLRERTPAIFHLLLFGWGWVSWTFVEYMSHRFWMHSSKHEAADKNDFANHHYHHTHPTEIRVTPVHRLILCAGFLVLVLTAIRLNGYFTLVTGFFAGFTLYFFMHVLLHKSWAAKIVGTLQEYHIYHHCKYTNRCFGVTVTWWDRVFGTTPPRHAKISDRIRSFYFGADHHHSTT